MVIDGRAASHSPSIVISPVSFLGGFHWYPSNLGVGYGAVACFLFVPRDAVGWELLLGGRRVKNFPRVAYRMGLLISEGLSFFRQFLASNILLRFGF